MTQKKLRKGFTTGAAAAAAVKAALTAYFTGDLKIEQVDIYFLNNETKPIDVQKVEKLDSNRFKAVIIKDAGDDPDVTHKAEIGATVTVVDAKENKVVITGGKGVGKITKPGLELPVGEYAINPGPRKMIRHAANEVLEKFGQDPKKIDIEIFVPKGEELAKKTLNARLGILGGISILGTTGIVTPMSHDAYIATIKSGISVAAANQIDTLVFTTGRRSERFAMEIFKNFKEEAFIQTGDFFKAAIDMALTQPKINRIIYTVFFGKAVKMALGFEHTHAAKSELTLKKLSQWAGEICHNKTLAQTVAQSNTAREAFAYIHLQCPELIAHVGKKIQENASAFSKHNLDIRAIIFDFEGNVVFNSD